MEHGGQYLERYAYVVVPGAGDKVVRVRAERYLADAVVRGLLDLEVFHGVVRPRRRSKALLEHLSEPYGRRRGHKDYFRNP